MRRTEDKDDETDERDEADIFRWIRQGEHDQQDRDGRLAEDQPGTAPADGDKGYAVRHLEQRRPEIFEGITDGDQRQDADRVRVDAFLRQPGRQHADNRPGRNAGRKGQDEHGRHAAVFQRPQCAHGTRALLFRNGRFGHAAPASRRPARPVQCTAMARKASGSIGLATTALTPAIISKRKG